MQEDAGAMIDRKMGYVIWAKKDELGGGFPRDKVTKIAVDIA